MIQWGREGREREECFRGKRYRNPSVKLPSYGHKLKGQLKLIPLTKSNTYQYESHDSFFSFKFLYLTRYKISNTLLVCVLHLDGT